jgi:ABC-type bacteriocin/lantibiotic exporter with double-glycine peptidase domain
VVLDESFAALDPSNLQRALRCVHARARAVLAIAHPGSSVARSMRQTPPLFHKSHEAGKHPAHRNRSAMTIKTTMVT